jgi:hypothetical protein
MDEGGGFVPRGGTRRGLTLKGKRINTQRKLVKEEFKIN